MAALDQSLISRELHRLIKRKNWAAREPGVVLVFCIIFVVAALLIGLFITRKFQARRAAKSEV